VADPSLLTAALTCCSAVAGVLTTWLRVRGQVLMHRARLDARGEAMRHLRPGGRFIEVDGEGVIIEVAPVHGRRDDTHASGGRFASQMGGEPRDGGDRGPVGLGGEFGEFRGTVG